MKQKKNHLCVDKDDIFHERVMENPLKNSNFKMHGTKNKGIFINAETYIKTLKNRICEYITQLVRIYILINQIILSYNDQPI